MQEEWKKEPLAKVSDIQSTLDSFRKDIRIWIELYTEERNIEECMRSLLEIRYRHGVMDEDWRDEVLYDPVIQKCITAAVEHMTGSKESLKRRQILISLQGILQPCDNIYIPKFPNATMIVNSITQTVGASSIRPLDVSDIVNLGSALVEMISQSDREKPGDQEVQLKKLQQQLELTMKTWSKTPKKSYTFLTCIGVLGLFGFNVENYQFDFYLRKDDLQKVSSALSKYMPDILQLSKESQKQAYVLNLAFASPFHRDLELYYMVANMPSKLCEDLTKDQKASVDGGTLDTDKLHTAVSELLGGKVLVTDLTAITKSLTDQFQFMKQPKVTQKTSSYFHSTGNLDKNLERLLEDLDMKQYYPQKLTYDDIITLTSHINRDDKAKLTKLKELPWYFMRCIIGLNSNIRENSFIDTKNDDLKKDNDSDDDSDSDEDSCDDCDDDKDFTEVYVGSDNHAIHPLDLIYVVFQCADDFLRQELADKMTKCQYAVPFILPSGQLKDEDKNLMLHWALRSMTRTFCRNNKVENGIMVDVNTHLVSCLSFGDETSWKSRLLNKMLSPQQDTFWHQGLQGGDAKQTVSEGMVDLAWYLPGGRKDDTFPYPVAFANLRGNAMNSTFVNRRLLKVSAVTYIFTSEMDEAFDDFLGQIEDNLDNIVIIVLCRKKENEKEDKIFKQKCVNMRKKFKLEKHQMIRKVAEDSNFNTMYQQMKMSMVDFFNKKKETSISKIASEVKCDQDMKVDDKESRYGRKAAKRILKDIDICNKKIPGSAKMTILPCQSNIVARQKIATLEKELCRKRKRNEKTTVQDYTATVKKNKWQLQLQQLQNPISETFKHFLQCLITLGPKDRKYFLQALKMGLNERSVQLLEPLYDEYAKCRLEEDSEEKKQKLEDLDQKLTHGSLGLEHFFREMAVMYDNISSLKKKSSSEDLSVKLGMLAHIMAQVLMEGTAIEIMDGDAVNVPVAWLNAVIEKVKSSKDSRIFKVSVLGAQSCGKSTLLNAVFGLNFPVSSGRCTRGAYMQLVKVDESLRETFHCDYVAVIDSEGLMSRAMGGRSDYDNELSTFIIGLSDLTLVIIKGEGSEMQDVLPLAIHAFLRMNKVGEHQACHFVHQNMGAVGVMTKVATEIDAFIRDLNEKTLTAAKDAGQADCYKRFTDVLQYDGTKDNTYVPGLWDGSPPMGKTNIHYSTTMQNLKLEIMTSLLEMQNKDRKKKCLGTLEDFTKRLKELWDAIKYENFIFSFKNVLAVEAHQKLSNLFDEEQWKMKREIRQMIQKQGTTTENEVTRSKSSKSVSALVDVSRAILIKSISNRSTDIEKKILHYFQCAGCNNCKDYIKNRHLLSENEKEFHDDIKSLKRLLEREMTSTLDKLEIKLKPKTCLNQLEEDMDIRLKEKVQQAIEHQKSDRLSEADKERIFRELWKNETGSILRDITLSDFLEDIEAVVQTIIMTLLGKNDHEYRRKDHKERAALRYKFTAKKSHMKLKGLGRKAGQLFNLTSINEQDQYRLQVSSDNIIQQTKNHYDPAASGTGREFTSKDAELLFKDVLDSIDQTQDKKFEITEEYRADLMVHIEILAVDGFRRMDNKYRNENSPQALLDKKRQSYYDSFMIQMGRGDRAVHFCNTVLKNMILINVEEELSCTELLDDLRINRGEMFRTIKSAQTSIMIELFKENRFEKYIHYIEQYETYLMNAMKEASLSHFQANDRFRKLAKIKLGEVVNKIIDAVSRTANSPCHDSLFIDTLFTNVDKSMKIPHDDAVALSGLDIGDKKQFATILLQQLSDRVRKKVTEIIDSWNVVATLENKNLTDFLFKEVIGCKAKCPFCQVPCDTHSGGKSSGNHSATLHRPQGLGGMRNTKSEKLAIDDCCLDVTTDGTFKTENTKGEWHPYKEYHKIYPDWTIHGNADPDVEKYWKWVFAQHNEKFAEYYSAKEADIPEEWSKYTREQIEQDIKDKYHVEVEL